MCGGAWGVVTRKECFQKWNVTESEEIVPSNVNLKSAKLKAKTPSSSQRQKQKWQHRCSFRKYEDRGPLQILFFFFLKLPLQILISIWVVLPDWYISNIVPIHNFLQKWIRTILWFMALMLINNNEISIQIQLLEQMKIIYSNIKNYKVQTINRRNQLLTKTFITKRR